MQNTTKKSKDTGLTFSKQVNIIFSQTIIWLLTILRQVTYFWLRKIHDICRMQLVWECIKGGNRICLFSSITWVFTKKRYWSLRVFVWCIYGSCKEKHKKEAKFEFLIWGVEMYIISFGEMWLWICSISFRRHDKF